MVVPRCRRPIGGEEKGQGFCLPRAKGALRPHCADGRTDELQTAALKVRTQVLKENVASKPLSDKLAVYGY